MNNLISVIIPTYNREKQIMRAVQSVLKQTYSEIEIIVVDDASTDNTKMLILSIEDPRIHYYRLEKKSGACVARNTGVKYAKGMYIAFQDSDDEWHREKLEKQIMYLLNNNYDFVSCGFDLYDERGKKTMGRANVPSEYVDCWCELLNHNWVSTQTILCKKECFARICFSPEIKRFQDWDIALQAALLFKMGNLNESLVDVFRQNDSITTLVNNGNPYLMIVRKHGKDVDFENVKMVSVYYKCLGDAKRRYNLMEAAQEYKKSLSVRFQIKVFFDYLACITGLIKFYKTRE